MNVDFVVVDKLPESGCYDCDMCYNGFCMPMHNQYGRIFQHYNNGTKPHWCPLMTYDQAFDMIMYERPATPHIVKRINQEFNKKKAV